MFMFQERGTRPMQKKRSNQALHHEHVLLPKTPVLLGAGSEGWTEHAPPFRSAGYRLSRGGYS
jgi:hypothetical protein